MSRQPFEFNNVPLGYLVTFAVTEPGFTVTAGDL